jgi:hypothetical protein
VVVALRFPDREDVTGAVFLFLFLGSEVDEADEDDDVREEAEEEEDEEEEEEEEETDGDETGSAGGDTSITSELYNALYVYITR